jgi:hypothetical protein
MDKHADPRTLFLGGQAISRCSSRPAVQSGTDSPNSSKMQAFTAKQDNPELCAQKQLQSKKTAGSMLPGQCALGAKI